jgi:hypothetical protein
MASASSSAAQASASSAAAAAAQATSDVNLGLQHFNTGWANIYALPVTQGSVFGVYYSGTVPYNNLLDALTFSCQSQKNLCSTYALANIFFPDSKCVSQFDACIALAKKDVAAADSAAAASSQAAASIA